jgi:hypothetical protein
MPDKNIGAVVFKRKGPKVSLEFRVPTGTKLRDTLRICDIVKLALIPIFQPGSCLACHSGRHYGITEVERVLPERPGKNLIPFDLKTGKLIQRG